MENVVHFMLVSDRDMKDISIAKEANRVYFNKEMWFGSLDANRYFTSEPKSLIDPAKRPWFVFVVSWTNESNSFGPGIRREEKIATNGEEWTYVKQSLSRTRIPFTDAVKARTQRKIEKFWVGA